MADVAHLYKFVRKANGIQDFQRAGLYASGTAGVGRPVVLVDNPAGNAMPIKLSGHEQAHWSCAHHQYLGVSGHQGILSFLPIVKRTGPPLRGCPAIAGKVPAHVTAWGELRY